MIAALLAAQAIVAAPGFAPPLDRPYQIVMHQERTLAGVVHRYEQERRLIFHREGDALIAEMTLVRVSQDIGGKDGKRFEAAAGALIGRTMRVHLAADGAVQSIDDEAALWEATLDGIRAAAAPTRRPGETLTTGLTRDPAAPLAALPPERRHILLAGPLASLIVRLPPPSSGPVTLASSFVAGQPLTGIRTVATDANAHLRIVVHVRGGVDDAVTLDREQVIDPATGLLLDEQETQAMGTAATAQTIRQHLTIAPMVR